MLYFLTWVLFCMQKATQMSWSVSVANNRNVWYFVKIIILNTEYFCIWRSHLFGLKKENVDAIFYFYLEFIELVHMQMWAKGPVPNTITVRATFSDPKQASDWND